MSTTGIWMTKVKGIESNEEELEIIKNQIPLLKPKREIWMTKVKGIESNEEELEKSKTKSRS